MGDPRAWSRLMRRPTAVVSALIIITVVLACVIGPFFLSASLGNPSPNQYSPPSWEHPFGTDLNGRDVLYRVLTGGRVSLIVGLCGALVSLVIGTTWGLVAGYVGGKIDAAMMRLVDIFYSVPRLIFILIAINAFNAQLQAFAMELRWDWLVQSSRIAILIVTLGVIEWLTMARIVRGQTISLRNKEFVEAARAAGARPLEIVFRHIVPNVLGPVVIFATLNIPVIILAESFLSFIGLGVQEPLASLGSLISAGAQQMINAPWMLLFPALIMLITLLALNFLGDGLRDALDPKER